MNRSVPDIVAGVINSSNAFVSYETKEGRLIKEAQDELCVFNRESAKD